MSDISAKISVEGAKEAQKALADTGKAAAKLDGTEVEIDVKADDKAAKKSIDDILKKVEKLDAKSAQMLIKSNADVIANDIAGLVLKIDQLDAEDPQVDIEVARLAALQGDLEQLDNKFKELDDRKITPEVDTTGLKDLDAAAKSADSSSSVMANTIGNAAQDVGALGGVAGTAGVAVGQMGEYMADALSSGEKLGSVLSNFGKVALPVAALGIGVQLVASEFERMKKNKLLDEQQMKRFEESVEDGTGALGAMRKELEETNELVFKFRGGFDAPDIGGDISGFLANVDIDLARFNELVHQSDEGWLSWIRTLESGGATQSEIINLEVARQTVLRDEALAAASAAKEEELLGEAIKDQTVQVEASRVAMGIRTRMAEEYADGQADVARWTEEARQALKDFKQTISTVDYGKADLDGALAGMQRFTTEHFGLAEIVANEEAAFDNLNASIEENGKTFDLSTEAGRANQEALEGVASTIDTRLAAAYAQADGDQAKFTESANTIATDTLARLQQEMNLSAEETEELARQLGLTPEDIATRYALSGVEEARIKIGLLQGSIDRLPEYKRLEVEQLIMEGDYVGALAVVQNYWNQHPATMSTVVNPPANRAQVLADTQFYMNGRPILIPAKIMKPVMSAEGNPSVPWPGGIAGEAGPEFVKRPGQPTELLTYPDFVPPGTRVTSVKRTREILHRHHYPKFANGTGGPTPVLGNTTINLNAAVIGNRFDVMRAVAKAGRDKTRIMGSRG